jgi:hypothetical protein
MRHAPQRVKTTGVEWTDGVDRHVLDGVAAEEPLEIRVGAPSSPAVQLAWDAAP